MAMTITTSLSRLQDLDTDIDRIEQELTEIRRRQARNPELETAERRLADLQGRINEAAARQRGLEADLSAVEARIGRDQTRMYSGQIVDARELTSLERELEHYRAQRDELEGQVLETMELADALGSQAASLEARVAALRETWTASRPDLDQRAGLRRQELSRLKSERDELVSSLDPRTVQRYTRLRATLGHAVAALRNGVCGECRVAVPPGDVQHVRSGALVTCSNCARILHAGG